jgi:hypothetical protein
MGVWGLGADAASGGGHLELQVEHPLFRYAYQGAGLIDSGENILDHGSRLVQNKGRGDAVGFEPVDDIDGAGAEDLLAAGKSEINVLFGLEPPGNEVVRGGTKRR